MQKKNRYSGPPKTTKNPGSPVAADRKKPSATAGEPHYLQPLLIAVVLVLTFIAYLPSLQNGLLKTWDDQAYITKNELVKSLAPDSIARIFTGDRGLYANYHPLTTLSLAVNYHFSKDDPFGYHLVNLLLHLANTLLVFIFIWLLTRKNLIMAGVTSLLFGVTPIHVESVAWISERKDVLYAFFFFASVIAYQVYIRKGGWPYYVLSLILFVCSMLSKAMAASLPLALLLVDYLEERKWSVRYLLNKIPFLAVAFLLGYYALRIQAESSAMGAVTFPFGLRVLHACYGFSVYILKILAPVGLSAFYPYPYPLVDVAWVTNNTPTIFYGTLILTALIAGFSVFCVTTGKKHLNVIGAGLLFFGVTIALVLQFLPVGRAIMADRYAYVPAAGLFLILGYCTHLLARKKGMKWVAVVLVMVYAGWLLMLTRQQTRVWKNDETLWTHVIRLYPQDNRIALAYSNRATYYLATDRPREALDDLLPVVGWNRRDDIALEKIGKIYGRELKDHGKSLEYFRKAHQANPGNMEVIRNLSTVYGIMGDFKTSMEYCFKGLEIKKDDAFLLYNAGIGYMNLGQPALGREYMDRALRIDPELKAK